jgi:hypothetical protein
MAEERVTALCFSGDEDEFSVWNLHARGYAARFGFLSAMGDQVEANLPAREGPGVGAEQQVAVKRNMKAVPFLMAAMPDLQIINLMSAGLSYPAWPNEPKAHLMMAYLQENYVEATTLSRVGARQDLENCTLKKDENPKVLFERLTAVQFKYHGNAQANVTEDDLVAQAVQALPTVYNLTVAGLYETERKLGNAVTLNVVKQAVSNHYAIAMRGKTGPRVKDIEGWKNMQEQMKG